MYFEDLIFKSANIKFKDFNLQCSLNEFNSVISPTSSDLTCYFLKRLFCLKCDWSHSGNYYAIQETQDGKKFIFYDFMKLYFGLEERFIQKCLKTYSKFITSADVGGEPIFVKYLDGFSLSKMFELLSLSNDTIKYAIDNGVISCNSTVKQIRQYVKSLKSSSKDNEVIEDDYTIEYEPRDLMKLFNPNEYYDIDFFEQFDKSELVTICLLYQQEYVSGD